MAILISLSVDTMYVIKFLLIMIRIILTAKINDNVNDDSN